MVIIFHNLSGDGHLDSQLYQRRWDSTRFNFGPLTCDFARLHWQYSNGSSAKRYSIGEGCGCGKMPILFVMSSPQLTQRSTVAVPVDIDFVIPVSGGRSLILRA